MKLNILDIEKASYLHNYKFSDLDPISGTDFNFESTKIYFRKKSKTKKKKNFTIQILLFISHKLFNFRRHTSNDSFEKAFESIYEIINILFLPINAPS